MELPKALHILNKDSLQSLGRVPQDNALLLIDADRPSRLNKGRLETTSPCWRINLAIYGSPTKVTKDENYGVWICPDGEKKFNYSVQPERKRGENLWDSFSEALVMAKLESPNHNYELHCDVVPSGRGGLPSEAYMLNLKGNLEGIFRFGAERMLQVAGFEVPETEVKKLADFLHEDYLTGRYTLKSHKIGMEADIALFPLDN